jgi:hypothetical protein
MYVASLHRLHIHQNLCAERGCLRCSHKKKKNMNANLNSAVLHTSHQIWTKLDAAILYKNLLSDCGFMNFGAVKPTFYLRL